MALLVHGYRIQQRFASRGAGFSSGWRPGVQSSRCVGMHTRRPRGPRPPCSSRAGAAGQPRGSEPRGSEPWALQRGATAPSLCMAEGAVGTCCLGSLPRVRRQLAPLIALFVVMRPSLAARCRDLGLHGLRHRRRVIAVIIEMIQPAVVAQQADLALEENTSRATLITRKCTQCKNANSPTQRTLKSP